MASKKSLIESDDEEDIKLEINRDYAKKYSTWRQNEELQKLKTKYGEEIDLNDSSSSEEDEDEDAEALTGTVDKSWYRVLAAVRSNDPRIYQKDVKFYDSDKEEDSKGDTSEGPSSKKQKKKEDKPMYMKDFERKLITEKGGILSESDDDEEDEEMQKKMQGPSYNEEQDAIKKSITGVLADVSSDEEEVDLLKTRVKTRRQQEEEEEEYIQFLRGEKDKADLRKDKDIAQELAPLREIYSRPDVNEDDKELWNIVLGQGFRSKTKPEDEDWYEQQMAELHDDEEAIEQQEEFENKYNFRFEEPDNDFVKTYERNPGDTVRQKENKRASKRQEIKERKQMEKDSKLEEIRQLKNLKRKEILDKLDQLKQVTGNPDVVFSAKDMEEEFDPAAHEKMMQDQFGDDFYEGEELEKPQFEDDDDDDFGDEEDWDKWTGPSSSQGASHEEQQAGNSEQGASTSADGNEDADFNMDADWDPAQASYTSGKKKKKSKFKQLMEKKRPAFDDVCKKYEGSDHPFGDYLDEYFKLDCEDIIAGDVKCRFRYRKTVPNDYGLSVEEILRCPEKELNAWAALKKITQFRNDDDELYEVRKYKQARMQRKKQKILPSLMEPIDETEEEEEAEEEEDNQVISKKKGKKRKMDEEVDVSLEETEIEQSPKKNKNSRSVPDSNSGQSPKKKKKKRKEKQPVVAESTESEVTPNKKKKKAKLSSESELSEPSPKKIKVKKGKRKSEPESSQTSELKEKTNGAIKKKKKKKKNPQGVSTQPSQVVKKKGKGKKMKKKGDGKPKNKGYQAGDMISESRLIALGVDPRKFKYTKHRIMQNTDKQE